MTSSVQLDRPDSSKGGRSGGSKEPRPALQSSKASLRIPITLVAAAVLSSFLPRVLAQAPVNDVVSWPAGLLLLATVLYAALGTSPDLLWEIEPAVGFFLFSGLPKISFPTMRRVNWVASASHFVPGIRSAFGKSQFWFRSNEVSADDREMALELALAQLRCVTFRPPSTPLDLGDWLITPSGMLTKRRLAPNSLPQDTKCPPPVARDFLLFAAIDYHVFREWEVRVSSGGKVKFNTKNMADSSIIDVASEEEAMSVVAAQMVRRPHGQSSLRSLATKGEDDSIYGPYILNLDNIDRNTPICSIDFHSYAPENHKVSATLTELARAYFRVVQYLNDSVPTDIGLSGQITRIEVGQTLWISILGGAILDSGRMTFQNLPGRWGSKSALSPKDYANVPSPSQAYVTRVKAVLQLLEQYSKTKNGTKFSDLVFSGGINRWSAIPFLIVGIIGQTIVCYFLSVGTSAGIWTSLALANSLYAGKLSDWHSISYGKRRFDLENDQPGMKMYLPGSPGKELMVIATLDRSTPKEGSGLRPGFFMFVFGLVAAILGAIFQHPTRVALSFGPPVRTPAWVVYTSIVLCIGTTSLILSMLILQQLHEKTWGDDSEFPTRVMIYCTLPSSIAVSALAVVFRLKGWGHLWPVLDAITFVSAVPMAMIENGRTFSADDNMLHLVLLNRWMMGAVASALGSSSRSGK